MRLTLTEVQARRVLQALEWAENPDYPDSDPDNLAYRRIENKIRKGLGEKIVAPETTKARKARQELEEAWQHSKISQQEYVAKMVELGGGRA